MGFEIVPLKSDYYEFIRDLRNDDQTKKGFIAQEYVTEAQHFEYMKIHATNYYVCLANNIPAGYIGVVNSDIRVAVHPSFLGLGIGEFMVRFIMKSVPEAIAKVKFENFASRNLFEKCGFIPEFVTYKNPGCA